MIISLFSFGLSWAIYAFVFYGLTLIMPQFHSSYSESTFKVAFIIGILDALLLKMIRVFGFKMMPALVFVLGVGLNYVLIRATSGLPQNYYVTGHKAPLIAGIVLALIMVGFEKVKELFFPHEWL